MLWLLSVILTPLLIGLTLVLLFLGIIYVCANYPEYLTIGISVVVFLLLSWFVGILTMGWFIEIFNL